MVIGVTGPSGAGKSEFSAQFAARGYTLLDCDGIYHALTAFPSACTREIADDPAFGPDVINDAGGLDRRRLSKLVFAPGAADKLSRLNAITHKYVLAEVRAAIAALPPSSPGAVIDAPLLIESGFGAECDFTVAVLAHVSLRIQRLIARDELDRAEIESRIAAGKSDYFYRMNCDYIVCNENNTGFLSSEADRVIREYTTGHRRTVKND